jgi:DNA polymerase-1
MSKRLLLIDGHSMAYRAFFALPAENFTTASGQHTNAIYGFATMLISLIKEEKPTHIAVAFDVSRKTFRTELFPEYKANRAKTPDEFRSQMSYLHELVDSFGIAQFEREGYEADDIIATISKAAQAEGFEISICTGDRDSFQLVNEQTTVLYPKRGVSEMVRMTPSAVFEKYQLTPTQYPDFAALRGDPSDNLPSVPGVGEKTAAKWIIEYGSLQELINKVNQVPGKAGESLRANIGAVSKNRELTQLLHDVPIELDLLNLAWKPIEERKILPLFATLEFRTLKDRLGPLLESKNGSTSAEMPLALFEAANEISSAEASKRIKSAKCEIAITTDFLDGRLISYSVAFIDGTSFTVVSKELGDWITDPKIPKIMHDAKSLARLVSVEGLIFDTQIAAYLINPGVRNQDIGTLLERWGNGSTEVCASALFTLRDSLQKELADRSLTNLFYELELPITALLAKLESAGIAVDSLQLEALKAFFENEVARESSAAYEVAGHEFNVASPKQLQVVLFDELNLPKTKKIKTGFTTDAESLEWLFAKSKHPLLQSLLRIRETNKLKSTVEGLLSEVADDGRIHTHFQQTVAATGRLSSTGPNLQNIPVRTEEGRKIRAAFVAGEKYETLLTADYSQIEMRIMAHLSNDVNLIAAFESGEDLHATVAAEVFGVNPQEVDPEMRRQIKAMSYGLAYGLSSFGLSAQLNISPPEASDLMDRYFKRFGGIRDYLKDVVEAARKVGYTETVMGRRRYLPDLTHDNRMRREIAERAALNSPIQGSAADIIKQAMLNVEAAIAKAGLGSRMLLQVHDELIFEVAKGELAELTQLVRTEMGGAYPLKAPLDVNIGIGRSWDEAAH